MNKNNHTAKFLFFQQGIVLVFFKCMCVIIGCWTEGGRLENFDTSSSRNPTVLMFTAALKDNEK